MKHARADYDRIQDPAGKIPEDEPVFLIRAQDEVAPMVVRYWALMAASNGAEPEIVRLANDHAALMGRWQTEHGSKTADLPGDDT